MKIINICADVCEKGKLTFPKNEWRELWGCIQQSTECLSFRKDDMNSVRYRFHSLYKYNPKGLPILDLWLDQKLTSTDTPVYIALWRALINKSRNLSTEPGNKLLSTFNTYQSHFKDPAFDEDLEPFFTPLCTKIKWNKIPLSPTDEEVEAACKALKQEADPKESKEIVASIKHDTAGVVAVRSLEMIHMEWLFLQCVCDQARRELMESVYLYLTKAAKDQA